MVALGIGSRKWDFFNWYYFSMGITILAALTVVVYVQENVVWDWGLGIPAIAMAIWIIAFFIGSFLYRKMKPGGSPLIRLAQVTVSAVKKRNEIAPEIPSSCIRTKSSMQLFLFMEDLYIHISTSKLCFFIKKY